MTVFSLFLKPLLCLCVTHLFSFFSCSVFPEVCHFKEQAFNFVDLFSVSLFSHLSFSAFVGFSFLAFIPFLSFLSQMLRFSVFFTKVSVSPFDCGQRTACSKSSHNQNLNSPPKQHEDFKNKCIFSTSCLHTPSIISYYCSVQLIEVNICFFVHYCFAYMTLYFQFNFLLPEVYLVIGTYFNQSFLVVKKFSQFTLVTFPTFVLKPINLSQKWIVCRAGYVIQVLQQKKRLPFNIFTSYIFVDFEGGIQILFFLLMTLGLMKILCLYACMHSQLCPTLYNPVDCSLPCSSVHGILLARILEWVAICYPRRSS